MNKQSDALDELIRKATQEAQDGQAQRARGHTRAALGGAWKLVAWVVICVVTTVWALLQLLGLLMPASQAQVRNDLALAARQARDEIEKARSRDGVLPDRIPNAALASLVRYEIKGTGYQLVVLTVKDRLEMDEKGTQAITERKNVQ